MPKSGQTLVSKILWVQIFLFFTVWGLWLPQGSEAVSQWSRKYKVDCSTCHLAFPRLNFFGEQFMRNGFQWPGEPPPDGDTEGKEELSENLFIDQVGNWLGARLSLTPLKYKTNDRVRNQRLEDSLNIGNPNWFQFFVAGSIFKNVSIFIEQEFEMDEAKFSWFHLFFTNLAGTYVNFQVGKLSPVDFTPFSDRLRIWQTSSVMNVKSSNGKGENSVSVRQSRAGIQYYGYKGPLVWFAGVDNGKDATDTDNDKNLWGGFRLEVPDTVKSSFIGSSAGFHYYEGRDTKGGIGTSPAPAPLVQLGNDFRRYTAAANIRYKENTDLQFVYQWGRDDNFTLTASPGKVDFEGFTIVGGHRHNDWWCVLQYDEVNANEFSAIEISKLSPSIWYFLRDNFKAGIAARFDVRGHSPEKHEVGLEIRTMF